jgi:hypothetical protein
MDRSGVGISLYNDKNGYASQTGAKVFAHHLILDYYSKQYLSLNIVQLLILKLILTSLDQMFKTQLLIPILTIDL